MSSKVARHYDYSLMGITQKLLKSTRNICPDGTVLFLPEAPTVVCLAELGTPALIHLASGVCIVTAYFTIPLQSVII